MKERINQANLPPALALAYIGDAVHSLYIRKLLVSRGCMRSGELNRLALGFVTAEAQARAYLKISHMLTEYELEVFKRASNSTHLNKPRHASGKDYRIATGFEAIIGMLEYLGDAERIEELLKVACTDIGDTENDTEN